jgi:putative membrane protein
MLVAAAAAGCASSGRGTTTTTSGGEVDRPGADSSTQSRDTTYRVPPAVEGIGGTVPTAAGDTAARPPAGARGAGVTGQPAPGDAGVASQVAQDTSRKEAGAAAAGAVGIAGPTGVGGAGAGRGAGGGAGGGAGITASSDADLLGLLHESNLGEIRAGTLAQRKATNAAVRSFASRMITDHTALDQHGSAIASAAGITPALADSALPRIQAQELAALQAATGATFDRAYMSQQLAAHQRTLDLVDRAIPLVQTPALKTALVSEVRPRVADHLRLAQQIAGQLGTAP